MAEATEAKPKSDMQQVVISYDRPALVVDQHGRLHVLRLKRISRDEIAIEWGDIVRPESVQTIDNQSTHR